MSSSSHPTDKSPGKEALFSIDEIDYLGFLKSLENKAEKLELQTVKCNSCGSTSTLDTNSEGNHCPYCGDELEVGAICEDAVISPWGMVPFEVEAYKAKEIIKEKLKKRWFKPSGLEPGSLLLHHFQAVYLPFWTFDCQMQMDYAGQRGDEVNDGQRVKLLWTEVTGDIDYFFDDILVAASGDATKEFIKGLSPWNIQGLVPFKPDQLKDVRVEKYQIDVQQGMEEAKQKIFDAMELFIRTDIGGDYQQIDWVRADYQGITFKHILLPVYTAAYKFKDKSYPLVINGKTGNFHGKIPRSVGKIVGFIMALLAVVTSITLLLID